MHFANCVTLCSSAAVFFTTLIEILKLCSTVEAEIALNFFLNFEQK